MAYTSASIFRRPTLTATYHRGQGLSRRRITPEQERMLGIDPGTGAPIEANLVRTGENARNIPPQRVRTVPGEKGRVLSAFFDLKSPVSKLGQQAQASSEITAAKEAVQNAMPGSQPLGRESGKPRYRRIRRSRSVFTSPLGIGGQAMTYKKRLLGE